MYSSNTITFLSIIKNLYENHYVARTISKPIPIPTKLTKRRSFANIIEKNLNEEY